MIDDREIIARPHIHLWTCAITGSEYGNALYDNDVDAALDFLAMAKNVNKYKIENTDLTIEMVMDSLTQGRGIYAGVPGFVVVLTRCSGGCKSPTWN